MLAIAELAGRALQLVPSGVLFAVELTDRPSSSDYIPLLLATTAFGATLLGLYFTALSVVVSTGYARATWGVRSLVLSEPAGSSYTRLVGILVAASLYLLAADFVGYQPPALTLVLLSLLGAAAVLALLFLGPRAFRMFDPVALAGVLLRDFGEWSDRASEAQQGQAFEQHYRERASATLGTYRHLVELALAARAADQISALHIALCRLWIEYSANKPRIPAESFWFERRQVSANWLRSDDAQIGLALNTGTSLPPTERIDRLWVEKDIAETLTSTVAAALTDGHGLEAYGLTVPLSSLVRVLAGALDMDSALLVLSVPAGQTGRRARSPQPNDGQGVQLPPALHGEILDAQGLIVVNIVLGVRDAADRLLDEDFWPDVARALESGRAPKGSPIGAVLDQIEYLRAGLEFEQRVEPGRQTPDWWLRHMTARRLYAALDRALRESIRAIDHHVVSPAESATDPEDAAILASRALEAVNKIHAHIGRIEDALVALSRAKGAKDENWPSRVSTSAGNDAKALHDRALQVLARHVGALADGTSDDSPDHFGQAYFELNDACLSALIEERQDRFAALFPVLHSAALKAYVRAQRVAAEPPLEPQLAFVLVSNPIIDLLDVSGYALICGELGQSAAWAACRSSWDAYFANVPDPESAALAITQMLDMRDLPAILPGDILRTSRWQRFERFLHKSLELPDESMFDYMQISHASPVVEVAAQSLGTDAHSIFVVKYLATRLAVGQPLPRGAQHVAESLELRERRGARGDATEDPEVWDEDL